MKHMLSISVALTLILCVASGCGKPPAPPAPPPPDPVAEFVKIINHYATDKKALIASYDVSKTDSLVSPLEGTFSYHHKDDSTNWQAHFLYQDKKWVLVRACKVFSDHTYCDDDNRYGPDSECKEERAAWEAWEAGK